MEKIIILQKWREQHSARPVVARVSGGTGGKLLLFTGVRYERREAVDHRSMDLPQVRAEQI